MSIQSFVPVPLSPGVLKLRLAAFAKGEPAMIVWGRNDPVLPVKDVEIARRVLPGSRIEVLDRCGHCPHVERSEAFCALVLDFLNAA